MKERIGNIWDLIGVVDAICVTTNGMVKRDGTLVMGAGIAKDAAQRFPSISKNLGKLVKTNGNIPHIGYETNGTSIVSFPTKEHWKCSSVIELIRKSCVHLEKMANEKNWSTIALPRPGVGLGQLKWNTVKPILEAYLDERFVVCTI